MKSNLLPKTIRLTGWIEEYDLRTLRRGARDIACNNGLRVGDALLVSGSRYKGARRFAFVIQTADGPLIASPQTGEQDLLLSLMLRVSEYTRTTFGGE